jgi:sulfoxide reductase heme-binding subunit YedZ
MTTWIILRAAGIGAYLMLFLSVAWGLVATTSPMGKAVSKASAVSIHQFMSTVAMALLGVHIAGLLLDRFVPFRLLDVVIPMHGPFRPLAVAFGMAAMYLSLVVLVSSWFRKRVGTRWWRRLHVLAAPAFTLAMVHGIFTGTDTIRPWMWWIYVVTGGTVVFLLAVRALTVGVRPARVADGARTGRPLRLAPNARTPQVRA